VRLPVPLRVNGILYELEVDPAATLLDVVRNDAGLTGAKAGCDDSECGACMMLLDNQPVNSCSYLAIQCEGHEVTTVEGLATGPELAPLQRAILEDGGVQRGFCTPGMLVSGVALEREGRRVTEDDVRKALAGNLCRCTGYTKIISAFTRAINAQVSAGDGNDPRAKRPGARG
jgi:aerobic-type carbon monoxide dehydrogenase small subunit (CoxS/CutS family)